MQQCFSDWSRLPRPPIHLDGDFSGSITRLRPVDAAPRDDLNRHRRPIKNQALSSPRLDTGCPVGSNPYYPPSHDALRGGVARSTPVRRKGSTASRDTAPWPARAHGPAPSNHTTFSFLLRRHQADGTTTATLHRRPAAMPPSLNNTHREPQARTRPSHKASSTQTLKIQVWNHHSPPPPLDRLARALTWVDSMKM